MDTLSFEEKRALDLMKKDNFRGISKDNVLLDGILNRAATAQSLRIKISI